MLFWKSNPIVLVIYTVAVLISVFVIWAFDLEKKYFSLFLIFILLSMPIVRAVVDERKEKKKI
ncbi:hypothetical protein F7984_14670 [Pradoshia sp. D12]|uniref:hypothetical protein n=1 Tax=Pradoshia sp. D12 TaxID=2651284 RepID=UPI00124DDE37|nr:hypothetical protein [Pradoshia sp. D12]QFK72396.1 hypothetical protein F7984_14670 [Pradoshia sp. D12]